MNQAHALRSRTLRRVLGAIVFALGSSCHMTPPGASTPFSPSAQAKAAPAQGAAGLVFNDAHVHLTNYVQEGLTAERFLTVMGNKVARAVLFGIPLQQEWSHRVSGDFAPTYYLDTDAPLYYYSFTDAVIATTYGALSKEQKARFDPMITGFNPADMYAADHVRRVLRTFPGVFSGIGEFSIHKEFVSAKVAGGAASLLDPALDRLLDFTAEAGLVALIHNDIDMPFAKSGESPVYLDQMKALVARHRNSTIIWAHVGLGRVIRPIQSHARVIAEMLDDPAFGNLYFDISWSEVAKYVVSSPEAVQITRDLLTRHPDHFLFGTDEMAPPDQASYLKVYEQYAPLWASLDAATSEKVRMGNYVRIFDEARRRVRAWEKAHP